ncbi:hypothetical protein MUP05_09705 [Candidatus Bathyarchaeota archaeon]|jgi:hypothetical protein|nr:hypothetical protein [Candidatus Bathyarchaeota archaeon]
MAADLVTMLGIYAYALFALGAYSFTYRDNVFFKFAEHTYLAVAIGYTAAVAYGYIRMTAIAPILTGKNTLMIVPLLLGMLFVFFFSKKYFWLYRFPIAMITGAGMGLAMSGTISAQFLVQIVSTITLPLVVVHPTLGFLAMDTINNWLIIIMVLGTLSYFFFSLPPESALGKATSKLGIIGRWTMMIAFGSAFGNTVMTRMNLFIGVYKNLLRDYTSFIGIAALILVVATLQGQREKKTKK